MDIMQIIINIATGNGVGKILIGKDILLVDHMKVVSMKLGIDNS